MICGKNTQMRKTILVLKNSWSPRDQIDQTQLKHICNQLKSNVGLIFTNGDIIEVRDVLAKNTRAVRAKVGQISPIDVVIPAGHTGLDPSKTCGFSALNICTKITKG